MSAVDDLITALHDSLCTCGGKCHGWHDDKGALLEFVEQRWGSVRAFEFYLQGE